jgi:hypothetical protein
MLSTAGQIALLKTIPPGQLVHITLSVFPFILLDNLANGLGQNDPYAELFEVVSHLNVPSVRLITSVAGLVASVVKLRKLDSLEIDDQGFWDGGRPELYSRLASDQHRDLSRVITRSTLRTLIYRRKVVMHGQSDYAFYDFAAILGSCRAALSKLQVLVIVNHTISTATLVAIFKACPRLTSFTYFPYTSHQLPHMPRSLLILRTNCHLPSHNEALPLNLQELCIRRDGPLIPPPPDEYVPTLPPLQVLHAHISPLVSPDSIALLLKPMTGLRDLEILTLPLPWSDDCGCKDNNDGKPLTYKQANESHSHIGSERLGWRKDIDLALLLTILKTVPLDVLSFNHDHHLSTHPFPDVAHFDRLEAEKNVKEWWNDNKDHYQREAERVFEALNINALHWRVCPWQNEAWVRWSRGELGELLVEHWQ